MILVEWIINVFGIDKSAELYRKYIGAAVPLRIEYGYLKRTGGWNRESNADWKTYRGKIRIGSDYISNERR